MPGPIHLQPTTALAERVLLPGDPGRALVLAQAMLQAPKMFNHNRGLWGYTGTAADGHLLTIQSTGMGGPSAAIVITELAALGAQRLVRAGTCGALDGSLRLGDLFVVTEALAADGTSRALGAGERVAPDPRLRDRLIAAAPDVPRGAVVTTDLFYDERRDIERTWLAQGAAAVEMETATLFAVAANRGLEAGAVLIVSDIVMPRRRIEPEALHEAEPRLGELALAAVGSTN